jgi:hypothetical protein
MHHVIDAVTSLPLSFCLPSLEWVLKNVFTVRVEP